MIERLVDALYGQGRRKGLFGGNRRWLTVWAVLFTGRTVHKLLKTKPVVERFELKAGETITITDLGVAEAAS